MDVNLTTKVVSFGTGAEVSSNTSLIVDATGVEELYGEDKSQFYPGDMVPLLGYIDPELVYVDIQVSSGSIKNNGNINRSVTEQVQIPLLFSDSDGKAPTLQYIPTGSVSFSWYGNSPTIEMEESQMKAVSGYTPAIGDATYNTYPMQFELSPPAMTLTEDETYPVLIVIFVE